MTPSGSYRLLFGYYRYDRLGHLKSELPLKQITSHMGWCDSPQNPNYNREISLPFSQSHETLSRKDRLYDICLVLDHNYTHRIKGRGSAVFFHLTNLQAGPTQGCIAIDPKWMLQLLPRLSTNTIIEIKA